MSRGDIEQILIGDKCLEDYYEQEGYDDESLDKSA